MVVGVEVDWLLAVFILLFEAFEVFERVGVESLKVVKVEVVEH